MNDADKILELITDIADLPKDVDLNADTLLFSSQLLNSMNLVELIVFLEETFDVKVKPMDIVFENFDTINLMLAYIERQKVVSA
jgi:acyl carrier protein